MSQVRAIDPGDGDLLARFQEVALRAEVHERPWERFWSLRELRARFEHPDSGERTELFGAFDGDTLLGVTVLQFPLLDNTDKVYCHVMVDPPRRRRGVGTELVEALARRVRDAGRTTMLGESSYPFESRDDHPYRRFAEKNGFSVANTEVFRVLELPVPIDRLHVLRDEAAPHHAAYRIETYDEPLPERYLDTYCHLQNQLVLDAPMGEVDYEEEAMTPQTYRENVARMAAAGRIWCTAVAVDAEERVVAFTDMVLPAEPPERALQWSTLVHRAHRGHRLGMAVKVANVLAVQRDHPERTQVTTTNAEVNEHMISINARLGFQPVALCPLFQRRL